MDPRDTKIEGVDAPTRFLRELQIEFLVHELKDPLSVIETGVRTLLERQDKYGALSRRQERTLQRTLRGAKKARGMLNDLLEVGRSEAGCFDCRGFRPAKIALSVLLDAVETMDHGILEVVQESKEGGGVVDTLARCGIVLEIDPSTEDVEIIQDEAKFCQIVGNLIKNALHHRQERVGVRILREENRICVEVSDDGPGIKAEHHQFIFQRYAQVLDSSALSRRGHGLGLAGARILARCLGGEIEVSSGKGKGAVFRLVLPLRLETPGAVGEARQR